MNIVKPSAFLTRERYFDEAAFVRFLEAHEDEDGRCELIDGIPILMPPATLRHARIAANLERLLHRSLEAIGSEFDARREAGLRDHSDPYFRPVADVAVIDPRQEGDKGEDRFYDHCALAAEVLSASTEHYDLIWKQPRYTQFPNCQYVLLISQTEMQVRLWSRADGFEEQCFAAGDILHLPLMGLTVLVDDLYKGVRFE